MESLARAGFSWHLNPGCLWYGSVSRLICQPFPHSAVGSEYLGTQGWGPGGEDGASSFASPGEWRILFTLPLPIHPNTEMFALSRSKVPAHPDLSREVSVKCSLQRPALTFVLGVLLLPLCQNFSPSRGRKWRHARKVQHGLTRARSAARPLMGRPSFCHFHPCLGGGRPDLGGPCALLSTANI